MAPRRASGTEKKIPKYYKSSDLICASKKRGKDTLIFMVPMTEAQKAEVKLAKKAAKIAKRLRNSAQETEENNGGQTPNGPDMATGPLTRRLKRLQATGKESVTRCKRTRAKPKRKIV